MNDLNPDLQFSDAEKKLVIEMISYIEPDGYNFFKIDFNGKDNNIEFLKIYLDSEDFNLTINYGDYEDLNYKISIHKVEKRESKEYHYRVEKDKLDDYVKNNTSLTNNDFLLLNKLNDILYKLVRLIYNNKKNDGNFYGSIETFYFSKIRREALIKIKSYNYRELLTQNNPQHFSGINENSFLKLYIIIKNFHKNIGLNNKTNIFRIFSDKYEYLDENNQKILEVDFQDSKIKKILNSFYTSSVDTVSNLECNNKNKNFVFIIDLNDVKNSRYISYKLERESLSNINSLKTINF